MDSSRYLIVEEKTYKRFFYQVALRAFIYSIYLLTALLALSDSNICIKATKSGELKQVFLRT